MKYFTLMLFVFLSIFANSQTIVIVQDKHKQPIPYAHICTQNLLSGAKNYLVTDKTGQASVYIQEKSIISVSYIGFATIIDTISAVEQKLEYQLTEKGFDVDEVVITGQHKPVCADKSIYRIKLIDETVIQKKAANNMAELLSNELNINILHDPSTGAGLQLQGISGQNVKILIDGVPVIGRLDGNIDLTQLPLSNVDHIEIVEGPMSVIYGSNALAGVINIITKDNKYAKFKSSIDAYYESVGVYNANGNISFRKNKNSLILTGGRNFFAGFDPDTATRSAEYKPKEQYNATATYSYLGNKLNIKFKNDIFKERLLNRSNLIRTPYSIKGYDTWFYTFRANSGIQIDHSFNQNASFNFLASYSYYNRSKLRYLKDMTNLETTLTQGEEDHDTTMFDAVVTRGVYNWHTKNEKFSIQAGFDINYEHGTGKRMKNTEESIADYAIFTGIKWNITPVFIFQPGFRAAYNTKYNAPVVPSANLKYSFEKLNFRISYARGFRAPSLKELYLFFYDSNHQIEGNADLKAEYSHNFNFSTGFNPDFGQNTLKFTLKAFYNNIDNMITLVQVDPENDLHYSNQNIGHFESLGGELNVEYQFFPYIKLQAGFSRLGRTDFYNEKTFIFNNNFNANLFINFWKNTAAFSVFYKLFGEYPFYTFYDDALKLNYLDMYQNLDISISKNFRNKNITISSGVKNLFNNTIISGAAGTGGAHGTSSGVSSLAGWGRTFFIGLKYNFTKY